MSEPVSGMSPSPTVDIHNHAIPREFVDVVRREGARHGVRVEPDARGVEWLVPRDGGRTALRDPFMDRVQRRDELAAVGIDVAVQSILPTLFSIKLDSGDAAWLARAINEANLAHERASGGHVQAMAHVPLPYPEAAVRELGWAVDQGMRSVQISTNVLGKNLDEPELFPFWDAAASLDVLVFVHPAEVAAQDRLTRYYLKNLIGNPLDTSIAVASIVFGGVLDRFPRLKLCFAHAGGYAPWIRGRWRHGQRVRPEAKERAVGAFDDYFARLYFDTVIHDEKALRYLVGSVGADRVLLGTDYPADMGDWTTQIPLIRGLGGLSEAERAAILGGNALSLLATAPGAAQAPQP